MSVKTTLIQLQNREDPAKIALTMLILRYAMSAFLVLPEYALIKRKGINSQISNFPVRAYSESTSV